MTVTRDDRPTPWLLTAIFERGGLALLGPGPMPVKPESNRRAPSADKCIFVLCHMAAHATVANRGQVHYSADVLAAETGIPRRSVQDALYALESLGLLTRTGKVRRSIRYMVLPDVVATDLAATDERPVQRPVQRPVERPDERPDERPVQRPQGRSKVKGKGKMKEEGAGAPPPACDSHPNGYHHNQRCRACQTIREWEQGRPTSTAPPIEAVYADLHAAVPASDEVRAQALADMVAELAASKAIA